MRKTSNKVSSKRFTAPKRLAAPVSAEIIATLGGTSSVAEICSRAPSTVSEWKRFGIPRSWLLYLRESYHWLPIFDRDDVKYF